jgi:hypothetical protein
MLTPLGKVQPSAPAWRVGILPCVRAEGRLVSGHSPQIREHGVLGGKVEIVGIGPHSRYLLHLNSVSKRVLNI